MQNWTTKRVQWHHQRSRLGKPPARQWQPSKGRFSVDHDDIIAIGNVRLRVDLKIHSAAESLAINKQDKHQAATPIVDTSTREQDPTWSR